MRAILSLFAVILAALASAQPITRLWIKTTSLPSTDQYDDVTTNSAGFIYACGSSIIAGKYHTLVVKFNSSGVKQWERLFPSITSGHSVGKSIALDTAGNAYVSGYSEWNPPSESRSRVMKISSAGVLVWDKVDTASNGSQWYDLAVNSLGEVTATGFVLANTGKVMRTTHFLANGTPAWSRDYDYPGLTGAPDQHGAYLEVDSQNNIYACGVHNDFPGRTHNTVVKYSRTGSQLWMRHVSNGFRDYPRGFILSPGNVSHMVCETTFANSTFGSMVVSFDSNGTQVGKFVRPSDFQLSIRGLAGDPTGAWITAGRMIDPSTPQLYRENSTSEGSISYFDKNLESDVKAIAMGLGGRDYYYSTSPAGSGARPATIYGDIARFGTRRSIEPPLWQVQIAGSTANGQTAFANVHRLITDHKGDVIAVGRCSGAQMDDAFIVKYETGPIARDGFLFLQSGESFSSEPGGYLVDDHQIQQATNAISVLPQHGTFSAQSDGTYAYQADSDFAGPDTFEYVLTRTSGTTTRTATGKVVILIFPNLVNLNLTPKILKGGQTSTATVTAAQFPTVQTKVSVKSSSDIPIDNIVQGNIAAGTNTATAFILTKPVVTAKTVVITASCGGSSITNTLTVTP